jgi:hypothetical protein
VVAVSWEIHFQFNADSMARQSGKPAFSLRRFAAATPQKMPLLTELENLFCSWCWNYAHDRQWIKTGRAGSPLPAERV